jgi:cytidylate kinase
VGRAADFVLKNKPNVLTVYIDAPYEDRIEREMKRQGIGRSQAIHYIDKLDHYRESYYKYHTGRQWKRVENYDLCLDSAAVGLDNCVEVIKKVIELKFGAKCPR